MEYKSRVDNIIVAEESEQAVRTLLTRFDCDDAKIAVIARENSTVHLRVLVGSEMSYFSEAHGQEREVMDDVYPFLMPGVEAEHRVIAWDTLEVQGWSVVYSCKGVMRRVSLAQAWGNQPTHKQKSKTNES